jgi:hypothetical protein
MNKIKVCTFANLIPDALECQNVEDLFVGIASVYAEFFVQPFRLRTYDGVLNR